MKYIRTKDGHIYNVAISVYGLFAMSKESRVIKEIAKKDIINQADTIEELCDVYVKKSREVGNDYFEVGKDAFGIFDRKYHREDLEHYDYYGAIWTDKGLIYVAKMNEKGVLELL